MKCIMTVEKLVNFGDGICGNGDINRQRKLKNWNTRSRREKMFAKVQAQPEKFITNYEWMLVELGAIATSTKIKEAIATLFNHHTRTQFVLFEKETGRRRSMEVESPEEETETMMDMSLDMSTSSVTTRSEVQENDRVQWEIERSELKAEIAELKAEIAKYKEKDHRTAPLLNLYRREKKVKNGVGISVVNPEINRISIVLQSFGIPVTKLADFHECFFTMFADCFVDPDSEFVFKPPSRVYLQELRNDLEHIGNVQIERWIECNSTVYLATDSSTTQKKSEAIMAVGLVNDRNEFISIKNSLYHGKDAKATASAIMATLPTNCLKNIVGGIGDSAHLQQSATNLVFQTLNEINNEQKDRVSLICMLHGGSSCSRKNKEAMPNNHKQFHLDLKILLARRQNTGYGPQSLKQRLEDRLIHFKRKVSKIQFLSDKGCRAGTEAENGLATIQYKDDIKFVIEEKITEIESQNESSRTPKSLQLLARLKRVNEFLLDENWSTTKVHLGSHILLWFVLARRIYKLENLKRTITEKKEDIKECIDRYAKIINDNEPGEVFEKVLAMSITAKLPESHIQVINDCGNEYLRSSKEVKSAVNQYIRSATIKAKLKLEKDTRAYSELPDSDKLVISTNRHCESVFGCYKSLEHQFPSMSAEMIEILTRCSRNKTGKWFRDLDLDEQMDLLLEAKELRSENKALRRTEECLRREKRLKLNES